MLASLVYLLYFRRVAPVLEGALERDEGLSQVRMARDVYSHGHLLVIGGIVTMALRLKKCPAIVVAAGAHGLLMPVWAMVALAAVGLGVAASVPLGGDAR